MRTVEHSVRVVAQCRELHSAGWSPTEIRRVLDREDVRPLPSLASIAKWVDPVAAERYRRTETRARRHRRQTDRMVQLRAAGLSYAAIAAVMRIYHGVELTGDQVRNCLPVGSVRV